MKKLWQKIKDIGQVVGDFQARLILSLLYFVLVLPMGLLARLGGDSLRVRSMGNPVQPQDTHWQVRSKADSELRQARRQH